LSTLPCLAYIIPSKHPVVNLPFLSFSCLNLLKETFLSP